MESINLTNVPTSTKPSRRLSDLHEKDRLLMQYAGIFKHNIKEFAATTPKKYKNRVNYAE